MSSLLYQRLVMLDGELEALRSSLHALQATLAWHRAAGAGGAAAPPVAKAPTSHQEDSEEYLRAYI